MRQRLCAALVLAISHLACARPQSAAVHCFESRLPDESVLRFQYTEHGGGITGVLDYDFAEKDGAHGTLTGQRDGDVGGTDKVLRLRDPEHAIFNETFDRVRCAENRD